jgi:prepilin-type N-terminal cleavage/methylation domain-containing protein
MNRRGMTLIEILIATTIGVLVLWGIGQVDVSRVRLGEQARRTGSADVEAALALAHMGRFLQDADLVNVINPTSVQFRRFIGDPTVAGDFDIPANYQWAQYQFVNAIPPNADFIRFDDNATPPCGNPEETFEASNLQVQFEDAAGTPPGGPPLPGPEDNNLLRITIRAALPPPPTPPPPTPNVFTTEVVIRSGAYTKVLTGLSPNAPGPPGTCP